MSLYSPAALLSDRRLTGFVTFIDGREVYLEKHWAAVRTKLLEISVPPQTWTPFLWRLANQGQVPPATTPLSPTMRLFKGALPQTDPKGEMDYFIFFIISAIAAMDRGLADFPL